MRLMIDILLLIAYENIQLNSNKWITDSGNYKYIIQTVTIKKVWTKLQNQRWTTEPQKVKSMMRKQSTNWRKLSRFLIAKIQEKLMLVNLKLLWKHLVCKSKSKMFEISMRNWGKKLRRAWVLINFWELWLAEW